MRSYGAVESKSHKHHEEEQRPESGSGHGGDGFRINDKDETRPFGRHLVNRFSRTQRHITQHGKDDETGQKTRRAVN